MDPLFRFLASPMGRVTRALAGLALLAVGLGVMHGVAGYIVALVGLVPLAAGGFDYCVFAPLVGLPFKGQDLRDALEARAEAKAKA